MMSMQAADVQLQQQSREIQRTPPGIAQQGLERHPHVYMREDE